MLNWRRKAAIGGALTGLALLAVTAGSIFAQQAPEPAQTPGGMPSHEQMHQMMDAVHGEGTSERMHEAMGPDAERLMDQCVAMMSMMQQMQGMMGGGAMSGMMDSGAMPGVTGGQSSQPMQDMMNRMMGGR